MSFQTIVAAEFRARPRLWLELMHPDDRQQAEAMMDRIAHSVEGDGGVFYVAACAGTRTAIDDRAILLNITAVLERFGRE